MTTEQMRYAKMGRSGLLVSRLSLGTMTFGGGDGMARIEQKDADRLVGAALDAGINLFDTADIYSAGESETILGRALRAHRHDAVIATKVGIRSGQNLGQSGLNRRHILASIEASLTRLGTDHVDLYLAHRVDALTPLEETLDALDTVVRTGKARYIGFSNWPAWLAQKAIGMQEGNRWARFVNGQVYYSLAGRDVEAEIVPFARDAGIGLTVWSPLAFGLLARPAGATGSRPGGTDFLRADKRQVFRIIATLGRIAEHRGVSPAAIAIAWLAERTAVASVTLGLSKQAHFEDAIKAATLTLDQRERAQLEKVSSRPATYPTWYNDTVVDTVTNRALG